MRFNSHGYNTCQLDYIIVNCFTLYIRHFEKKNPERMEFNCNTVHKKGLHHFHQSTEAHKHIQ